MPVPRFGKGSEGLMGRCHCEDVARVMIAMEIALLRSPKVFRCAAVQENHATNC